MCMAWHSMLSERVGSMHARKHFVCTSLVQNAVCTCCAYVVVWKRVCVKWPARTLTYVKAKDGDTDKGAQVWRDSLISLSFQFDSSLHRCLSFSLSHCRRSQSYSYQNYALHCSPCAHTSASMAWPYSMPAWACATYPYHVNGTDMVGRSDERSVGRTDGQSVDACVPVDHASVGFAHARPKNDKYIFTPYM